MATIDIKLKSYDELIFEITKLNTDKYLLQQENKQLKEQLEYLRSNEYLNQVKWERTFNEELVKDLQQRIDKAIKWIKDDYDGGYFECGENDIKELLEILEDKE